ncbi:hypothetical protein TNCT_254501 [Trichonephila clavata]|uniref:Uncharacterized protein n=1 Tax=Trichonephila clavata TaxID=2740835 RepID=A0A8X6IK42_TRICU|nr:hypothetical protein TNCT_254501 [Trichonephila clavata]
MANMEVDSPIIICTCGKRLELEGGIAANEILITTYLQLINVPDTEENRDMKDVVMKSITETMQGKDAMAVELESLPPRNNPNCSVNKNSRNSSPIIEEIKTKVMY